MNEKSNRRVVEYTTYRLPANVKALIYTLAGLLTLSIAANIFIAFSRDEEPVMVIAPNTEATTEATTAAEEEVMTTTETTTEEQVRYYDVPLSEYLQDYILFLLNFKDIHEDISLPLILAIIEVESDYQADIISKTNDYGLMQINESNHQWLAEQYGLTNMLDARQNLDAGIIILNDCINNSPNMHAALTAYNRGLGGAKELWAEGVYETEYSRKVLDTYERIRRERQRPTHPTHFQHTKRIECVGMKQED